MQGLKRLQNAERLRNSPVLSLDELELFLFIVWEGLHHSIIHRVDSPTVLRGFGTLVPFRDY